MGMDESPTMRHLSRTHGISVAVLHELFQRWEFQFEKEPTASMSADLFTNGFLEASKWKAVCDLINVVGFSKIKLKPATWQWKEEEEMDHARNKITTPKKVQHPETENGEIGQGNPTHVKSKKKKARKTKVQKTMLGVTSTSLPMEFVSDSDAIGTPDTCWIRQRMQCLIVSRSKRNKN